MSGRRKLELNIGIVTLVWTFLFALFIIFVEGLPGSNGMKNNLFVLLNTHPVEVLIIYLTVFIGIIVYMSLLRLQLLLRWSLTFIVFGITIFVCSQMPTLFAVYVHELFLNSTVVLIATCWAIATALMSATVTPTIIKSIVRRIKERVGYRPEWM